MTPSKPTGADGRPMIYRNTEMKLDALINYLEKGKINLVPAFQRGHVWTLTDRKKLMANVVMGRPFPSIFLYKDPSGSRYSYNILDGKQRIETLILFIGSGTEDLGIANWADYFYSTETKRSVSFAIDLPTGKKRKFADLDLDTIRDLREYSIPIIEITIKDDTEVDEIIDLFVDINQRGEEVKRFDIVKAMGLENALLHSVFDLVGKVYELKKDVRYRQRQSEFNAVLGKLSVIANTAQISATVDRIWERLLEIALFVRKRQHSTPVEVLKRFIRVRDPEPALTDDELECLRRVFRFLRKAYARVGDSRLATDQTHFYTMATSLIDSDLMDSFGDAALIAKLEAFAALIEEGAQPAENEELAQIVKAYLESSSLQTTHPSRRRARQKAFVGAVKLL